MGISLLLILEGKEARESGEESKHLNELHVQRSYFAEAFDYVMTREMRDHKNSLENRRLHQIQYNTNQQSAAPQ